jgi:hypothetical protein
MNLLALQTIESGTEAGGFWKRRRWGARAAAAAAAAGQRFSGEESPGVANPSVLEAVRRSYDRASVVVRRGAAWT